MTTIKFQLGGKPELVEDQEGYAIVTLRYDRFTVTARGEDMAYTLPDGNKVEVKIEYVDSQGNAAAVDGDVEWSSSNTDIVTVEVDPDDPQKATVAATEGGTIGQAQIIATADADLGAGVREIITTMDVEVVAGEAVAGTITPVGAFTPI